MSSIDQSCCSEAFEATFRITNSALALPISGHERIENVWSLMKSNVKSTSSIRQKIRINIARPWERSIPSGCLAQADPFHAEPCGSFTFSERKFKLLLISFCKIWIIKWIKLRVALFIQYELKLFKEKRNYAILPSISIFWPCDLPALVTAKDLFSTSPLMREFRKFASKASGHFSMLMRVDIQFICTSTRVYLLIK